VRAMVLLALVAVACGDPRAATTEHGCRESNSSLSAGAIRRALQQGGDQAAAKDVAFIYIAMGPVIMSPLFFHATRTAREHGNWKGEIFVITDRPHCAPPGTTPLFSPSEPPLGSDMDNVTYYKMMKTRVFSLLPLHVMYAIYLDSDIVIRADVQPLLDERFRLRIPTFGVAKSERSNILMFARLKPDEPAHSGVVIAHRVISRICLSAWGNQMLRLKHTRDQAALGMVVRLGVCKPGPLPEKKLASTPTSRRVRNDGPWKMLVHVTRTGQWERLRTLGLLPKLGEQLLNVQGAASDTWWFASNEHCRAVP